jgi:recombination protein RecA
VGDSLGNALAQTSKQLDLDVPLALASAYGVGDVSAWIPSGIAPLDRVLGGGLPLGRISEVFSINEGDGKTTLLLHFAAQVTRVGGIVIWLESDVALDKDRAERIGVDLDRVPIYPPETIEDGFAFIDRVCGNVRASSELQDVPILVVWDGVAIAPSQSDLYRAGEREKATAETRLDREKGTRIGKPGSRAGVFWDFFRQQTRTFWARQIHVCLVNQTIKKIGVTFGKDYTTPGGKSIKAQASLRLELKRLGWVKAPDDTKIGIVVRVTVAKNKLATPYRVLDVPLLAESGFDEARCLVDVWKAFKGQPSAVSQGGGWYTVHGVDGQEHRFHGQDALTWAVMHDAAVREALTANLGLIWPWSSNAPRVRDDRGWWVPASPRRAAVPIVPEVSKKKKTSKSPKKKKKK